ncbi:MAG: LicD family protein [Clostridia bacterium]|nr:LicD family protein [Clostridia bacterium]
MSTVTMRMEELHKLGTEMLKCVAEICEEEKINYCMFFGSMLAAVRHQGPIPWDYDIDITVPENEYARFISVMEKRLPDKFWVDFRSDRDTPKCFARIGLSGFDTRSLHIDVYRLVGFPESMKTCKSIVKRGRLLLEMRLVKDTNIDYFTGKKRKKVQLYRKLLLPISTKTVVKRFDKLCGKYPYEKMDRVGLNACKLGVKYIYDKGIFDDTILVDYCDFKVRIPREYDSMLRQLYGDYMQFPEQEMIDSSLNADYVLHKLDD